MAFDSDSSGNQRRSIQTTEHIFNKCFQSILSIRINFLHKLYTYQLYTINIQTFKILFLPQWGNKWDQYDVNKVIKQQTKLRNLKNVWMAQYDFLEGIVSLDWQIKCTFISIYKSHRHLTKDHSVYFFRHVTIYKMYINYSQIGI